VAPPLHYSRAIQRFAEREEGEKGMKKLLVLMFSAVLFFSVPVASYGAYYFEEYRGTQYVSRGQTTDFLFDLRNSGNESTNTALKLTTDASGAYGSWMNSTVHIRFYAPDIQSESVSVAMDASYDGFGNLSLGSYSFWAHPLDPYYNLDINLPQSVLNAMTISSSSGMLHITANWSGLLNFNDFDLKRVGIEANVPEPMSLLLLGLGLLGIGAVRRKK
jgi:hypothetical protein